MITLKQTSAGVLFTVKAITQSRVNALRGELGGLLKVAVNVQPENGRANEAIHELLCVRLGLAPNQLELYAGPTNAVKKFLVVGVSLDDLTQRLERAIRSESS